jgi:hypothetical protein
VGETVSGRNGEWEALIWWGEELGAPNVLIALCDGFAPVLSRAVQVASPIP